MADPKLRTTPPVVSVGPRGPRPPSLEGVIARRDPERVKAREERQKFNEKRRAERDVARRKKRAERAAAAAPVAPASVPVEPKKR